MKSVIYLFLFSLPFLIQCKSVEGPFTLIQIAGPASCSTYHIEGQDGAVLKLPANISAALDCPGILSLEDDLLVFLDGDDIKLYDLNSRMEQTLYSCKGEMDGYSNPLWLSDKRSLLFVLINQQRKYGFKESGRIVRIDFTDKSNFSTQTYDRSIHYVCGSMCNSEGGRDFKFDPNGKIQYRRNENITERPGVWEEI